MCRAKVNPCSEGPLQEWKIDRRRYPDNMIRVINAVGICLAGDGVLLQFGEMGRVFAPVDIGGVRALQLEGQRLTHRKYP